MRKSKLETAATRQKIIEVSRVEFRRHGIDGSGLTALMAAAGLTQGGFYKHFESKAHLVAEATKASVDDQLAKLAQVGASGEEADAFNASVATYLSVQHRDESSGCPFAALGSELARAEDPVKTVAVEGFEQTLALLTDQLAAARSAVDAGPSNRDQAMLSLCAMMGALTVARMAEGRALSEEVLAAVRRQLQVEAPAAASD